MTAVELHSTPGQKCLVADVSMFSAVTEKPRVVADSNKFIVYALKNPAHLRVLNRANNKQCTFKLHKNEVEIAKFVNYRSNVLATASKTELYVSFVATTPEGEIDTRVYFNINNVNVRSLCWYLDAKVRAPDMLVIYDTSVAQLSSSSLITAYQEAPVEAKLADIAQPFERTVSTEATLTAVGADTFAFAVDASNIVTCTARNSNAPAWRPCDGETVLALEVLQDKPAVLVAACNSFVSVWGVDGEPSKLYKITIDAPILTLLSSQTAFAIFGTNKDVHVVDMDLKKKKIAQNLKFVMELQIQKSSVTFNATESGFAVIGDFGTRLSIHTMRRTPPQATAAVPAVAAVASPVIDPAIAAAGPALPAAAKRPQQYVAPPPEYSPIVIPAFAQPPPPVAPRVNPLNNPTLPQVPQDGQIAQTLEQCQQELTEAKQRLESAAKNATEVLNVVPQMVRKDHATLITLALESQMTELQKLAVQGELGGNGGGGAAGFESQVLAILISEVSRRLGDGLTQGLQDSMLYDLEPALKTAVVTHVKKNQKDVFKNRIDAVLKNVAVEFIAELERKQKVYERNFENYGKDVRRAADGALQKLSQYVTSLEDQLNAITQSGIIAEVKQLRQEVAELRAAAAQGAQDTDLSPVTIITTAKALLEGRDAVEGIQYVIKTNQKDTIIAFFEEIGQNEDLTQRALDVKNPSLWCEVIYSLALCTRTAQLKSVLQWLKDINTDHHEVAKQSNVRDVVARFVAAWKPQCEGSLSQELKVVEKLYK